MYKLNWVLCKKTVKRAPDLPIFRNKIRNEKVSRRSILRSNLRNRSLVLQEKEWWWETWNEYSEEPSKLGCSTSSKPALLKYFLSHVSKICGHPTLSTSAYWRNDEPKAVSPKTSKSVNNLIRSTSSTSKVRPVKVLPKSSIGLNIGEQSSQAQG